MQWHSKKKCDEPSGLFFLSFVDEVMNSSSILFLDIETVPAQSSRDDLDESRQHLWKKKIEKIMKYDDTLTEVSASYMQRAGIFAEFGKVICISVGYLREDGQSSHAVVKSFAGHDEKELLSDFFAMVDAHYSHDHHRLCGHNIIEFDVPYLCRRGVVHGLKLPALLQAQGKKPRELPYLDTLEMRKFGDKKNYTSLDLLCHVLGIATPKHDISGDQVAWVYRWENDLDRIVRYCECDVKAVIDLYQKLSLERL